MSRFSRAIFLLIVIGVLSLGIFVVYEGMALDFDVHGPLLAVPLAFLTLSFVGSLMIGRYSYNTFTRAYYLLSAIWIGFFTYAFLASVGVAITALVLPSYVSVAASFLYGMAALTAIYGVLHARSLVTKHVTAALPNVPDIWKGRKAVWLSDVHFGQLYGAKYAERIVDHIAGLDPDIIFVGGDLFDGTTAPDAKEQVRPFKRLFAPLGIYFITGNHEEYGNLSRFLEAVETVGMRILRDERIEIDGLQIIGVDFRTTSSMHGFKKTLSDLKIDIDRPSLLLKHGPEHLGVAHEAGISFQISGHTHNGQMWPLTYIANMVHHGYGYGLKVHKDMQIYTSSGAGTWGPPLRVGTDCEIALITFS